MKPCVVNIGVGLAKERTFGDKEFFTAIVKRQVLQVEVNEQGLIDDCVGNPDRHGGEDKAVCVFGVHAYKSITTNLKTTLPIPSFGENLTVSNFRESDVRLGDVYQVGSAQLQISGLRFPCVTLEAYLGDARIIPLLKKLGYVGFYCRVVQPGTIAVADYFQLVNRMPAQPTVAEEILKAFNV